jgi:formylglycine-generating enzyme required for sulfatase activity
MNLTSQYIVNPKSREAYFNSEASYKSIRTTITRLRLIDDRYVLKPNKNKNIYFKIDNIYFNMLYCPRGVFMMGSNNESDNPKRPMVIERPFLLGETEVTQELFETIMGYNPSGFQGGNYPNSKQRPVEKITWYDAVRFCNKLSLKLGKRPYYNVSNVQYEDNNQKTNIKSANVTTNPNSNGFRLPLEKEWEYAVKARTNNDWAGTNNANKLDEIAWFEENSGWQTHPVKGKRSNEWGFYDMSGNVWEWCYDKYESNSAYRVYRGGSWINKATNFHSAYRNYDSPDGRDDALGFRVSASLVK